MYNIVIFLYLCGVAIASIFNEKVRKMWRGERWIPMPSMFGSMPLHSVSLSRDAH